MSYLLEARIPSSLLAASQRRNMTRERVRKQLEAQLLPDKAAEQAFPAGKCG